VAPMAMQFTARRSGAHG